MAVMLAVVFGFAGCVGYAGVGLQSGPWQFRHAEQIKLTIPPIGTKMEALRSETSLTGVNVKEER
jgi:hypothetical protein